MGAAFRNFAYIFLSYIRADLRRDQRKRVKTCICTPFPIKSNVTLQPMGAAFRKFADIFRSYIKAE